MAGSDGKERRTAKTKTFMRVDEQYHNTGTRRLLQRIFDEHRCPDDPGLIAKVCFSNFNDRSKICQDSGTKRSLCGSEQDVSRFCDAAPKNKNVHIEQVCNVGERAAQQHSCFFEYLGRKLVAIMHRTGDNPWSDIRKTIAEHGMNRRVDLQFFSSAFREVLLAEIGFDTPLR